MLELKPHLRKQLAMPLSQLKLQVSHKLLKLRLSSQSDLLTVPLLAEATTLAPPQPIQTSREGSATTDTKLASAVDRSIGLTASSIDEELKKRKARAERFGTAAATTEPTTAELDAEALRALERAKRFGTGQTAEGTGVGKLDEALPMEREKRGKRGLEESAYDDPGLRQGRGGKRRFHGRGGRDNNRRGERPEGVKKQSMSVSDKDRAAAEARKKRFTAS
jgi:SAP domain-containing ribonucleoprotein